MKENYYPGKFTREAIREIKETGRLSRRILLGASGELLGGGFLAWFLKGRKRTPELPPQPEKEILNRELLSEIASSMEKMDDFSSIKEAGRVLSCELKNQPGGFEKFGQYFNFQGLRLEEAEVEAMPLLKGIVFEEAAGVIATMQYHAEVESDRLKSINLTIYLSSEILQGKPELCLEKPSEEIRNLIVAKEVSFPKIDNLIQKQYHWLFSSEEVYWQNRFSQPGLWFLEVEGGSVYLTALDYLTFKETKGGFHRFSGMEQDLFFVMWEVPISRAVAAGIFIKENGFWQENPEFLGKIKAEGINYGFLSEQWKEIFRESLKMVIEDTEEEEQELYRELRERLGLLEKYDEGIDLPISVYQEAFERREILLKKTDHYSSISLDLEGKKIFFFNPQDSETTRGKASWLAYHLRVLQSFEEYREDWLRKTKIEGLTEIEVKKGFLEKQYPLFEQAHIRGLWTACQVYQVTGKESNFQEHEAFFEPTQPVFVDLMKVFQRLGQTRETSGENSLEWALSVLAAYRVRQRKDGFLEISLDLPFSPLDSFPPSARPDQNFLTWAEESGAFHPGVAWAIEEFLDKRGSTN